VSAVINHLNIVTRDLEGTARFFVDTFGFEAGPAQVLSGSWVSELTGYPDASATHVTLTPPASGPTTTCIELLTYLTPASPPPTAGEARLNDPGYRHIGFVVDDLDGLYRRLKPDWKFFSPPVEVAAMNLKTVYFVGPEDIVIQLLQPLTSPPTVSGPAPR
jgi:catechol 2,3-dioxygenase-like lactoylglutathione lyase family enzyme